MSRACALVAALLLVPCVATAQLGPGTATVVRGHAQTATPVTAITAGQTMYLSIDGSDLSATQADVQTRMEAGTLRDARAYVSVAPGGGQSVTFTAQSGACGTALADSSVVVTVSGTNRTADDLTNSVPIAAGECATWKVTYSASAQSSLPRVRALIF